MIVLCPKCQTAYDKQATYCNLCDFDLSDKNQIKNIVETNKKAKSLKLLSIILFFISIPLLFLNIVIIGSKINIPIGLIASIILLFSSYNIMRRSYSLNMLSGEHLKNTDPRRHVLFLRSFERDNTLLARPLEIILRTYLFPTPSILTTYEESLVEELSFLGPVVAIKNPNKKENHIGSAPIVAKNDWKKKVVNLAEESKYVVIMLDSTPGLLWEINNITSSTKLSKIIFLIPYVNGRKWLRFKSSYEELKEDFEFLPDINNNTVAIVFTSNDMKPEIVQAKSTGGKKKIEAIAKKLKSLVVKQGNILDNY